MSLRLGLGLNEILKDMKIKDIIGFLPSGRLGGGLLLMIALPLNAQKLQVIDKEFEWCKVVY